MGMAAACPVPPRAETPGFIAMNWARFPVASLAGDPPTVFKPVMIVLGVVKMGILAPPPVPMMAALAAALLLVAAMSCGEMMAPPPAAALEGR